MIGDEEVPLQKLSTTSTRNCCRVKLVEKVRLAPLSEAVNPVRVDQVQANYQVGLLEQAEAMAPLWWPACGLDTGRPHERQDPTEDYESILSADDHSESG